MERVSASPAAGHYIGLNAKFLLYDLPANYTHFEAASNYCPSRYAVKRAIIHCARTATKGLRPEASCEADLRASTFILRFLTFLKILTLVYSRMDRCLF